MTVMHADTLFAPLDADLHLERVAGGNETEVYSTDDKRFVVKVKSEENGNGDALAEAMFLRAAADAFAGAVGPEHSLPNYYVITQSSEGQAQTVVLQPYLRQAKTLFETDYRQLSPTERRQIADQLRRLIRRALAFYRETGQMPDMYGRTSRNTAERRQLNSLAKLPWRLWSFIVKRNLLRSHNLMLSDDPERRITLVDYDPVRKGKFYRFLYYAARHVLFIRDYLLIGLMEKTGYVPRA